MAGIADAGPRRRSVRAPRVVAERVRHVLWVAGNGIVAENIGCLVVRQPGRPFRPVIGGVVEALAVAVQPQHPLANRDGMRERLWIGGQGNAETRVRGPGRRRRSTCTRDERAPPRGRRTGPRR